MGGPIFLEKNLIYYVHQVLTKCSILVLKEINKSRYNATVEVRGFCKNIGFELSDLFIVCDSSMID